MIRCIAWDASNHLQSILDFPVHATVPDMRQPAIWWKTNPSIQYSCGIFFFQTWNEVDWCKDQHSTNMLTQRYELASRVNSNQKWQIVYLSVYPRLCIQLVASKSLTYHNEDVVGSAFPDTQDRRQIGTKSTCPNVGKKSFEQIGCIDSFHSFESFEVPSVGWQDN